MFDLDSAIKRYEEVTHSYDYTAPDCKCAEEHRQLAEWLKELVERRKQPGVIECKDCKKNPKETWFECPMAHLSEKQRPDTAWCWKAERRTDE